MWVHGALSAYLLLCLVTNDSVLYKIDKVVNSSIRRFLKISSCTNSLSVQFDPAASGVSVQCSIIQLFCHCL